MNDLALCGGTPIISDCLRPYSSVSDEEANAVADVVRSGCLSGFFGSWEEGFLGGPKVREFEAAWATRFGVRHVVSVNSNTSGLYTAVGAAGIGPGDEVIIPCTTMSATAMAPLVYGGIPVFADIEEETFCIDLNSVNKNLSDRTKAIIAVNLFGHPASLTALRKLCDERRMILIEDNAQAPLAMEGERYCGTIGHIGVFSLNYHKHIHTGEGGMCCTDDDRLAQRMQMIRNHAEAVVGEAGVNDLTNMVGFNFRMTELSAAIGLVQLNDIDRHIQRRKHAAETLSDSVADLEGIHPPIVRSDCEHVYYNWTLRYDAQLVGPSRHTFVAALIAEGFPCSEGYVRPLYMLPLFQHRKAIGKNGFPFTQSKRLYSPGMCPVAERLYQHEIVVFQTCTWDLDENSIKKLVKVLGKVYSARKTLVEWEERQSDVKK